MGWTVAGEAPPGIAKRHHALPGVEVRERAMDNELADALEPAAIVVVRAEQVAREFEVTQRRLRGVSPILMPLGRTAVLAGVPQKLAVNEVCLPNPINGLRHLVKKGKAGRSQTRVFEVIVVGEPPVVMHRRSVLHCPG